MKQAFVLAAGLGTRLKPYTETMPKALVPVGGKPLLWHTLQRLHHAGYARVIINIHHFGDQILHYLEQHDRFRADAHDEADRLGLDIHISDERDLLRDTGGALRHARPFILPDRPLLVHNVDIFSDLNLQALEQDGEDTVTRLVVSERQTQRYLLFRPDDLQLQGWTNTSTGDLRGPVADTPEHAAACRQLAFAGIHLFSPALLPHLEAWPERFSIIDFYLDACRQAPVRAFFQPDLRLLDVGKLDTLAQAETWTAFSDK